MKLSCYKPPYAAALQGVRSGRNRCFLKLPPVALSPTRMLIRGVYAQAWLSVCFIQGGTRLSALSNVKRH